MATYCLHIYEEKDQQELIDEVWFDHSSCLCEFLAKEFPKIDQSDDFDLNSSANLEKGSISWGNWPGGVETEEDVYCETCKELMWHGLEYEKLQEEKTALIEVIVEELENLDTTEIDKEDLSDMYKKVIELKGE